MAEAVFQPLNTADLKDRRVVIRTDFNVPMLGQVVRDDARIRAHLPSLRHVLDQDASCVILSHRGRPNGAPDPELSLEPVASRLADLLGRKVIFAESLQEAERLAANHEAGRVIVAENVRFSPGETDNDPALAASFARLGDVFVNDAFSVSHRDQASVTGITAHLPSLAGFAFLEEVEYLERALETPKRPLMAVVGGAKVSSKLPLLQNLLKKVDTLALGGGIANTFLAAKGHNVQASLYEPDLLDEARRVMDAAERSGTELVLPHDVIVAESLEEDAHCRVADVDSLRPNEQILDTGPATVADLQGHLDRMHTLVWNGPLGAFEVAPFDKATVSTARHAAALCASKSLLAIGGGGDTTAALSHANVADAFSHVSTAGGAFLQWLEGRPLPGIEALRAAKAKWGTL